MQGLVSMYDTFELGHSLGNLSGFADEEGDAGGLSAWPEGPGHGQREADWDLGGRPGSVPCRLRRHAAWCWMATTTAARCRMRGGALDLPPEGSSEGPWTPCPLGLVRPACGAPREDPSSGPSSRSPPSRSHGA